MGREPFSSWFTWKRGATIERRRQTEKAARRSLVLRPQPSLTQITPVVELVGVFGPAVADIGAIVHVGDEDILGTGIDLGLSLLHGLTGANDDENNAGSARNQPLAIHCFYVFDVNAFHVGFLENDGVVF